MTPEQQARIDAANKRIEAANKRTMRSAKIAIAISIVTIVFNMGDARV